MQVSFLLPPRFSISSSISLLPLGQADPKSDPVWYPNSVRALYLLFALIAFSDSWGLKSNCHPWEQLSSSKQNALSLWAHVGGNCVSSVLLDLWVKEIEDAFASLGLTRDTWIVWVLFITKVREKDLEKGCVRRGWVWSCGGEWVFFDIPWLSWEPLGHLKSKQTERTKGSEVALSMYFLRGIVGEKGVSDFFF